MGEVIIYTFESQKMNVLECASQSISLLLRLESSKSEFAKLFFSQHQNSFPLANHCCLTTNSAETPGKNSFSFSVNCSWRISVSGNMLQWSSRSNKLRQGRALMWSQTCVNSIIHQFSLGCLIFVGGMG